MINDDKLKAEIYAACLKSAIAMGIQLKTISWFGRNKKEKIIGNLR